MSLLTSMFGLEHCLDSQFWNSHKNSHRYWYQGHVFSKGWTWVFSMLITCWTWALSCWTSMLGRGTSAIQTCYTSSFSELWDFTWACAHFSSMCMFLVVHVHLFSCACAQFCMFSVEHVHIFSWACSTSIKHTYTSVQHVHASSWACLCLQLSMCMLIVEHVHTCSCACAHFQLCMCMFSVACVHF